MRESPGVERRGIAEQHQRQGHLCQKSDVTDIDVGSNHVEDFVAEQTDMDLQSLGMLDWEFITDGSAPFDVRFGIDDLRLE